MLSPTLLGVIICVAAAVLEGALAGKGVRHRLAQLACHLILRHLHFGLLLVCSFMRCAS